MHRLREVSDDADISPKLARHWITMAKASVLHDYMKENEGEDIESSLLRKYCLTAEEVEECGKNCKKLAVKLPESLYDDHFSIQRPNGAIIDCFMSQDEGTIMTEVPFGPDSFSYRMGDTVYLQGKFPSDMQVVVYGVPKEVKNDDESFCAPDYLTLDILAEAEAIGRRLIVTPGDITNDGKDLLNA